MRGDIVDLAVAVIIGGAFGKIVASFVHDILMPLIGRFLGGVDFANPFLVLAGSQTFATPADAKKVGVPTLNYLNYGVSLQSSLDFIIIAFSIFLVVKQVSRMRRPAPAAPPPATKDYGFCLMAVPARATRWPHCTSQLG